MTSTRNPVAFSQVTSGRSTPFTAGGLQMLLYNTAVERLGVDAIRTGMEVTGYRNHATGCGVTALVRTRRRRAPKLDGALLIGADGLHSAVRAQMHPDQPPIQWGGAIMWRGTTPGVPIRTGASFVGLGTHRHRVVFYPISQPDTVTGLADHQLDRRDHRR